MHVEDGFRAYVLEQLAGVKHVRMKAMFGGVGLYADDVFFGILAAGALYFKVDDTNRAPFEEAGMAPFRPYADKPMTMSYWQVPAGVLEDAGELAAWARAAILVATRAGTKARPARRR